MKDLQQAIEIIKNGGVAIFPTDTAFGIGCRIDNEEAVQRVFAIKKRSETHATPVLVSSIAMAEAYFQSVLPDVKNLMQQYWPGALTIVYPCNTKKVSSLVRGGTTNIGLRMPNHDVPLTIIKSVGVPIIGTSANFHGEETPYMFDELDPELVKKVDVVISGVCSVKQSSTIIDCSVTPWEILREGVIRISAL